MVEQNLCELTVVQPIIMWLKKHISCNDIMFVKFVKSFQ